MDIKKAPLADTKRAKVNLEFIEIASAFLKPRNDVGNSRIFCDEILGSSRGMR